MGEDPLQPQRWQVVIDIDGEGSIGRPIGQKKAKAQRNVSTSGVDASVDTMIAEVVKCTKERDEERDDKNDATWKVLFEKADQKIKLKEAKVEAAKVAPKPTSYKP
jgi:cell fate regulator YaaT (PSP1 superfamily)